MATPFTVQATLSLPGTPGLPVDAIAFAMAAQYDSKAEYEYNLAAETATKAVDFGTMPAAGAKAVVLYYEPLVGGTVIDVTINAADTPVELTPGGMLVYCSPTPVAGITAISLAYTGAGRVRVWLLG